MRFSKRTYPLLCDFGDFLIREDFDFGNDLSLEENNEGIRVAFNALISRFTKVSYVSNVFLDAACDNQERILDFSNQHMFVENELSGLFYCYINRGFVRIGVFGVVGYVFLKKVLMSVVMINKDGSLRLCKSKNLKNDDVIKETVTWPLVVGRFKQLSNIEAKLLPPKKKTNIFNCRYKSDINLPIELLTENWYTESLQGHPFVVRGHWRMQPHGRDREKRKLIWIDEFMKQGYTKGAYKEQ